MNAMQVSFLVFAVTALSASACADATGEETEDQGGQVNKSKPDAEELALKDYSAFTQQLLNKDKENLRSYRGVKGDDKSFKVGKGTWKQGAEVDSDREWRVEFEQRRQSPGTNGAAGVQVRLTLEWRKKGTDNKFNQSYKSNSTAGFVWCSRNDVAQKERQPGNDSASSQCVGATLLFDKAKKVYRLATEKELESNDPAVAKAAGVIDPKTLEEAAGYARDRDSLSLEWKNQRLVIRDVFSKEGPVEATCDFSK